MCCEEHPIKQMYIQYILKGRVQGLAHAHESKCCFSPVLVVASMQAILFHNIVKESIRSEYIARV